MEKRNYFFGFRKQTRDRYAKLLGAEPIIGDPSQFNWLDCDYKDNFYFRSIEDLNVPFDLSALLKNCLKYKSKLVFLKEHFCFDGNRVEKKPRINSVLTCKIPPTGLAEIIPHLADDYPYPSQPKHNYNRKITVDDIISIVENYFEKGRLPKRGSIRVWENQELIQQFTNSKHEIYRDELKDLLSKIGRHRDLSRYNLDDIFTSYKLAHRKRLGEHEMLGFIEGRIRNGEVAKEDTAVAKHSGQKTFSENTIRKILKEYVDVEFNSTVRENREQKEEIFRRLINLKKENEELRSELNKLRGV